MTPKQYSFVRHKLEGLSNKAAVIAAGYSPNGAKQAGTRLMKHPTVLEALKGRDFDFGVSKVFVSRSFERTATCWQAVSDAMPKRDYSCPVEFLTDAMNCQDLPITVRAGFAAALLPYQYVRVGR